MRVIVLHLHGRAGVLLRQSPRHYLGGVLGMLVHGNRVELVGAEQTREVMYRLPEVHEGWMLLGLSYVLREEYLSVACDRPGHVPLCANAYDCTSVVRLQWDGHEPSGLPRERRPAVAHLHHTVVASVDDRAVVQQVEVQFEVERLLVLDDHRLPGWVCRRHYDAVLPQMREQQHVSCGVWQHDPDVAEARGDPL